MPGNPIQGSREHGRRPSCCGSIVSPRCRLFSPRQMTINDPVNLDRRLRVRVRSLHRPFRSTNRACHALLPLGAARGVDAQFKKRSRSLLPTRTSAPRLVAWSPARSSTTRYRATARTRARGKLYHPRDEQQQRQSSGPSARCVATLIPDPSIVRPPLRIEA